MELLTEWPPTPDQYYRKLDPDRPFFQGDVFDDVPFVTVRAGDSVTSDPKTVVDRRRVCALLYPCDMHTSEGTLARVQAVAVVRERKESERLPSDWAGCFNLFPYPGLGGDDAMWVADFRTTANVDRSYLRADQRIASLSALGWAYFRSRVMLHYTRAATRLEPLMEGGSDTWVELELWQEWASKRNSTEFQKWYNSSSPGLTGFSPKAAIKRGMLLDVKELMHVALES